MSRRGSIPLVATECRSAEQRPLSPEFKAPVRLQSRSWIAMKGHADDSPRRNDGSDRSRSVQADIGLEASADRRRHARDSALDVRARTAATWP